MQAPAFPRSFWLAPETRAVLAVIVAGVAARLLVARLVGLTVDESYAVAMSRHLDWSYYDHPPAMFWLAGLATRLAQAEDVVAVRVPFILLFAATTWLMYLLRASDALPSPLRPPRAPRHRPPEEGRGGGGGRGGHRVSR